MNSNIPAQGYPETATPAGAFLQAINAPNRLEILLAIGSSEACVCHLETALGLRQAYISQHLMALRATEVLSSRKEGRFVYYRLANPELLDLIRLAWLLGGGGGNFDYYRGGIISDCPCPHCTQELVNGEDIKILENKP